MCFIVLILSGCSTMAWQHSSKGEAAFHRDQNNCITDSYRVYPKPQQQQPTYTYSGSSTNCTGLGNSINCTTTPNVNVMNNFPSPDYSSLSRNNYRENCMRGKGWRLVEQK